MSKLNSRLKEGVYGPPFEYAKDMSFLDFLLTPKLECLLCGALCFCKQGLCPICLERLKKKMRPVGRVSAGLRHLYLFDWVPGESNLLSAYLESLKRKSQRYFWDFWARELLQEIILQTQDQKPLLFVPVPSSKEHDHAYGLAQSLAALGGGRIETLLRKAGGPQQKKLSRIERARQSSQRIEKNTGLVLSEYRVIIVDDILTTGSSVRSAYNELGSPEESMIVTLAFRQRRGAKIRPGRLAPEAES